MKDTGTLHTSADGWTIDTGRTIAALAARRVKWEGGKRKAAERRGITLEQLRRDLADQRLPPEPRITPEAMEVLARPLPALDVPPPGQATEADLIRLCDFLVSVTRDFQKVDWVSGTTLYDPPPAFVAKCDALFALQGLVEEAIIDIPAVTMAGVRAKGRALMAGFDPGCNDLDQNLLVWSILADCGVDEWSRIPSPGWLGERDGTVPVSAGEPVKLKAVEAALAA